ncbi:MAG: ferredoxin [Natronomonas sp.]
MSDTYRISVDLEACDGIFACLVRDGRFEESADGLVTLPDSSRENGHVSGIFEDDARADAESAAAACPLDAITVEGVERTEEMR